MVDFNTPQSKVVKRLLDAYSSLDMNNAQPLLSKNYQYLPFPENTDLPKQTKEGHLQMWGGMLSSATKFEMTPHEVIEAPGKVVLHVSSTLSTVFGTTLNYDTVIIYTLVEEDGELKILLCKDFGDPQQRSAHVAGTLKAAAKRVAA